MNKRMVRLMLGVLFTLMAGCGDSVQAPVVTGQVQVTLAPAAAVSAGARWTLDSDATQHTSGDSVVVAVGAHTVHAVSPGGWSASDQGVTVSAGTVAAATVTFAAVPVGSVRVTLAPAAAITAGARWTLDSSATQHTSGETVANLAVGAHTVHFSTVAGYGTPADASVTVAQNATATATGTYVAQTGSVQVNLAPAAANTAGARWTLDSDPTTHVSGATVTNVPVGSHTLHCTAVAGYATPADQVFVVANNALSTLSATYAVPGGSVQVTITPAAAVTAGARWTLDSGSTQYTSGASVPNVSVGSHTVHFTAVAGYTTPANASVNVTAGNTASASGVYTATALSFATSVLPQTAACSCHGSTMTNRATLIASGRVVPGNAAASSYVTRNSMQGYWSNRQAVVDWINQGANP